MFRKNKLSKDIDCDDRTIKVSPYSVLCATNSEIELTQRIAIETVGLEGVIRWAPADSPARVRHGAPVAAIESEPGKAL